MRCGVRDLRTLVTALLISAAWAGVVGGGPEGYTNKAYFDDDFKIPRENSHVYALAKDGLGNVHAGGRSERRSPQRAGRRCNAWRSGTGHSGRRSALDCGILFIKLSRNKCVSSFLKGCVEESQVTGSV